jgi:hypothetical protein
MHAMMTDTRVFRRTDPDFPITAAVQRRLIADGRVEGEGPHRQFPTGPAISPAAPAGSPGKATTSGQIPVPDGPSIPLGETDRGTLHLDLNRLLAGRCLIQGSSGAGKSATLRHLIEEAHDYLTVMIVDPELDFPHFRRPCIESGGLDLEN